MWTCSGPAVWTYNDFISIDDSRRFKKYEYGKRCELRRRRRFRGWRIDRLESMAIDERDELFKRAFEVSPKIKAFECWKCCVVSLKQFGIILNIRQYEFFWEERFLVLKRLIFDAFIGVLCRGREERIHIARRHSRRTKWIKSLPRDPSAEYAHIPDTMPGSESGPGEQQVDRSQRF